MQLELQLAGLQVKMAQGQPLRHSCRAWRQKSTGQAAFAVPTPVSAMRQSAKAPIRDRILVLIELSSFVDRVDRRAAGQSGSVRKP
ncbi:MAG TPA: hypothetical protein VLX28_14850, partial [Thermoanaerobaculia bacterium]|nr:hypothetical protein [Thermoanaerobaculia bacterium]